MVFGCAGAPPVEPASASIYSSAADEESMNTLHITLMMSRADGAGKFGRPCCQKACQAPIHAVAGRAFPSCPSRPRRATPFARNEVKTDAG